jgi:hypothetical protein
MTNDPTVWVFLLCGLAFLGTLASGIWFTIRQEKELAKNRDAFLEKLHQEGFPENELKSVATYLNGLYRDVDLQSMIPVLKEELGKEEFLIFVDDCNKRCPPETTQQKICIVGTFFVVTLTAVFVTGLVFH